MAKSVTLARAGILRTLVLSLMAFSSRLSSSDGFNAVFCGLTSYIGCTPDSNTMDSSQEIAEDTEEVIIRLLFLSNGRLLQNRIIEVPVNSPCCIGMHLDSFRTCAFRE
jgi:hypothetical protein